MALFLSSLLVLLAGPALYGLLRSRAGPSSFLDGFVFVSMGGLIFAGLLPDAISQGGYWALALVFVGLLGPSLVERNFHRFGEETHRVSVVLGLIGIAVHAALDGLALTDLAVHGSGADGLAVAGGEDAHAHAHGGGHSHLPVAVVLHRFPVGLTVWWLLRPRHGRVLPSLVLGLIALATCVGYVSGDVLAALSERGIALFQAFVAGSLLHVVAHRPHLRERASSRARGAEIEEQHGHAHGHAHAHSHAHEHEHEDEPGSGAALRGDGIRTRAGGAGGLPRFLEGVGGALGLAFVIAILSEDVATHESRWAHESVTLLRDLALASAPALLFAYLAVGALNAFLPRSSMTWLRRGGGATQALKGMAVGLPFPICSCGVVPLYRSLILRGAPATAAMAFLVATPELGLDAVLISVPLLGGPMTVARVVVAAILAFVVGWWVGRSTRTIASEPGGELEAAGAGGFARRLAGGLRTSFGEGLDHTAPWIVLGLLVAAMCAPLLESAELLERVPPGLDVLVWAVLGVPLYVCASGATPLVAVLLVHGMSPGAALAFLLTGPATNVTTFGVLTRLHGKRTAVLFSVTMLVAAVGLGYLANALPSSVFATTRTLEDIHEESSPLEWVCLAAVAACFLASFLRRGPRRFIGEIFSF